MRVRVSLRINAETGEVELFQVDDLGAAREGEAHDAVHDEIAHRVGRVLDPRPLVEEDLATRRPAVEAWAPQDDDGERGRTAETQENG
ncbi:hypothetical protein [Saccharothrix sp.]|uniref:hypothetical protein n=1 Tax=Saccharothrix sp. TaxID=1873460 RepID=UPI002811E634|nr:hypothetical protein [Saccharothrix sp.]